MRVTGASTVIGTLRESQRFHRGCMRGPPNPVASGVAAGTEADSPKILLLYQAG